MKSLRWVVKADFDSFRPELLCLSLKEGGGGRGHRKESHASHTISPLLGICKWATLSPTRCHLMCACLIS